MKYEMFTRDSDGSEFTLLEGTGESILTVLGFEECLEDHVEFEIVLHSKGVGGGDNQRYYLRGSNEVS